MVSRGDCCVVRKVAGCSTKPQIGALNNWEFAWVLGELHNNILQSFQMDKT